MVDADLFKGGSQFGNFHPDLRKFADQRIIDRFRLVELITDFLQFGTYRTQPVVVAHYGKFGPERGNVFLELTGFRAGIVSVHPTQREAARSLGMSAPQAMRYVVLPQALRNVIPAMTGELIALVKESSLLFVISLHELTLTARTLAAHQGNTFEFYTILAVYYLMLTLPLAGASYLLEKRLARND